MASYQGKRASGNQRITQNRDRRGKSRKPVLLLILLLVLALILGGAIWFLRPNAEEEAKDPTSTAGETTEGSGEETEEEAPAGLTFPYQMEDKGLEIVNLLSSDLMNPDGGNEMVEQLASLEVTNTSEQYLTAASIQVTLTDGTVYQFQVNDLPAGGTTIAFETANGVYDSATPCDAIQAETEFTEESPLMEESVAVSVEGTTVTLTNLTQEELGPLTVVCHDTLDETEYFGGSSYTYQTETIPAGGSVTVEAVDCIIGQPAVVRITSEH